MLVWNFRKQDHYKYGDTSQMIMAQDVKQEAKIKSIIHMHCSRRKEKKKKKKKKKGGGMRGGV